MHLSLVSILKRLREGLKWKARSAGACASAGLVTESPARRDTPQ